MDISPLTARLRQVKFHGDVMYAEDSGYEAARKVWNGVFDKRPAAIVKVRSVEDIVSIIDVASRSDALLAVRGGGHSLPGLSTCNDGIVLDMSRMNHIKVDPTARTAEVEGGSLLGDLDRAGTPHGLVVPAGVVSHTGAAGLTLGGGMGWLSRRYGLTIDSLISVDLVTANGTQITASAEVEPELFWGLRGGGGNFGVVTKFKYRMHPLGPVSVGDWQYPIKAAGDALRRLHELADVAPRELTIGLRIIGTDLKVTAFWSGAEKLAGEMIAPFGKLAAEAAGMHGPVEFVAHQSRNDDFMRWGRRYYTKGGFFGDLTDEIIGALVRAAETMPTPDSDIIVTQLGGAVTDARDSDTAYTGRAAKYYWLVSPVWDEAVDDRRCLAWGRKIAAEFAALSMSGNYVNEQGDVGKEVAKSAYGAEKYSRLQKLKSRFDPKNLFRLNQNIEPAA
jgi:FAD/FMN-containing dehydrogenase